MNLRIAVALASAASLPLAILTSFAVMSFLRRRGIRICFSKCMVTEDLEVGQTIARVANRPEKKSTEQTPPPVKEDESITKLPRRFSWTEVEAATENFTSAVIGKGGFSTVYLARLDDSSQAAVKIHHSRVFRVELDVLLRVRNPLIVRLIGYCDEREEQGALVFEYTPNGSLHEKLHATDYSADALPWARRTSIAHQLAQAVDYLHEGCKLQIVHGDIKTANVLLDENINPKLCDFGCARMGFSAVVRPRAPIIVSPGYVDPHYIRTGVVSTKSDVYSFGVLLLELITGLAAFDSETEKLLAAVAGPFLREVTSVGVKEIIDPRLGGNYDAEEAMAMASLSALCLVDNPSLRPSMADIVRILREMVLSPSALGIH
ncbi:hypothetical protein HPP92_015001 [Vanilla planifolia]|uniref:Protein kinase domain-containing protein n=1 Tax=Vanilla planifolia TaxID=51239 RepID=A0A835QNP1_VANPL|nr:hypothetical protein HPP92_015001 [Vanilla planifolia]